MRVTSRQIVLKRPVDGGSLHLVWLPSVALLLVIGYIAAETSGNTPELLDIGIEHIEYC